MGRGCWSRCDSLKVDEIKGKQMMAETWLLILEDNGFLLPRCDPVCPCCL